VKICLYGRGGKVGRVLAPALEAAGHELVDSTADARRLHRAGRRVDNVLRALDAGVPCVVGTSGPTRPPPTRGRERGLPVFFAPNFAIGAVLMMRSRRGGRVPPRAEIVELHNEAKKDAPSDTRARHGRPAPRRRADSQRAPARSRRAPGGAVRRRRPAADHQARRVLSRGVRPGVLLALERLHSLPPGLTVGLDALL
jgi:dihydrodipicolinate reductase